MSKPPTHAQRWIEREARWTPERQRCNTRSLEAAIIEDDATAKAFVMTHHYSGSYPAARLRVGLYEHGELVGVAVFSEPPNVHTVTSWTGRPREEGVEIGRFVLLDRVGYNAESWFWARARRLLREHKPDVRVILAYSDPVERRALDGKTTLPGHVGTIYQATNGAYLGRARSKTLLLDPSGQVVSARALSKIRNQDRGKEYASAMLEDATHTSQRPGETPREWVARAQRELRKLAHPGNHVYAWGVTRRDNVPRSKPYPRQHDAQQTSLF